MKRNRSTASAIGFLLLAGLVLVAAIVVPIPQPARGQIVTDATPSERSTHPLADPVLNIPAKFKGNKASAWNDGEAKMLLLEGDVSFALGTYGFRAERAVVRIEDEGVAGRTIHHLSIYFDKAGPLEGQGPVQAQAPRLLVTASTTVNPEMTTDLLRPQSETNDPLVVEAMKRIEEYNSFVFAPTVPVQQGLADVTPEADSLRSARRQAITEETAAHATAQTQPAASTGGSSRTAVRLSTEPKSTTATKPAPATPPAAATKSKPPAAATGPITVAPIVTGPTGSGTPTTRPAIPEGGYILPATGVVTYLCDRAALQPIGNGESVGVLMGHVQVIYENYEGKPGATLQAENVVVFLTTKALSIPAAGKFQAGDVRGVYLEDNAVATYDQYTVRAPRVLYDLASNKAIVLDAVMYSWDVRRQVPIYVRAEKLRQETATVWTAHNAAVTTSEFAVPHFSIAARELTIRQETREDGTVAYKYDAHDATARAGTVPVFYWPELSGDIVHDIPLRRAEAAYSNKHGPIVRTTWDLFTLADQPRPEGVQLDGELDYLGDHGPAMGAKLDYDRPQYFGSFEGYMVPYDQGDDDLGKREDISHDGDFRGFAVWRHRQLFPENWELSLEGAYVSDPTFLEEFFRRQAEESKPYETSAYVKKQEDDWAFTFLASYDVDHFLPQTTTLQAPGYTVDKLPELGYYRVATPLWGDRLTYYTETRASRMRIRSGSDTPADRGFTQAQSDLLFGIPRDLSFDEAVQDEGYPTDYRLRLDTRHEIDAPLKLGMFDATPYVAGRFTGYDDDMKEFAGTDDQFRFWGTAGIRFGTQFSRTYDNVENSFFALHRLRHLIEPYATVFYTDSNVQKEDLPVFDQDVEGIQNGPGVQLGIRNILQTQRGGDGRWRNVDWLIINTDLVLHGDDHDNPNPDNTIARFIDYRPEFSLGGDHFHADIAWQISDTLAAVSEVIQNLENGATSEWRVGLNLQHTPELATFIDYTDLDPLSSRLLTFGFAYHLTTKYTLTLRQTVDLGGQANRSLDITLTRKLPRWQLIAIVRIDEVEDQQSFSIVLVPDGINIGHLADPLGITHARE